MIWTRQFSGFITMFVMLAAPVTTSAAGPVEDGHQQMVRELARLAAAAKRENPFLGEGIVERLEPQLAEVTDPDDPRNWSLNMELGRETLKLGQTDRAVKHFTAAYQLMDKFREEMPAEQIVRTTYELAVAYMRQGENTNCAMRHTPESCILPIRGGGVHTIKESSQQATVYFLKVLEMTDPGSLQSLRAQWLLNIAYMTLGEYPAAVPEKWRIPEKNFDSDEPFPRFTNIAAKRGLDSFDLAGGAVVDDFDADGRLDVVVTTSHPQGQMRFYRNAGDQGFIEQTAEAGLTGITGGLNMNHADYDNDGDLDLFVMRGAWWKELGAIPQSLLRNNGDGTFSDVTFAAGLGKKYYPSQAASWADYDNDGDLDLYVGNEFSTDMPAPAQLFRNNGDGTFTDVAARAGVENRGYSKAVGWGDYDGDRFPDIYVSNLGTLNRLYRNNGDGTFTDVAGRLGVTRPVAGFATWFFDVNNDGHLDLFAASYGGVNPTPDVAAVAASYLHLPFNAELDHIYLNDGQGGFDEVGRAFGMRKATLPMGGNFGDLDNDGFPDFYLGTGYPHFEALVPNRMYHNLAGRGFADVTTSGGFGHLQKGHGIAFADLDNDGDQDVFEQMGGQYLADAFGNALFENNGFGNHWIKIRLVGSRSNRFGIGARIRVDIVEGGRKRSIHRYVSTGGSFGDNPLRSEIGLGSAAKIETLVVFWPTSGITQTFLDVSVDQAIEIDEDSNEIRPAALPRIQLSAP